MIKNNTFIDVNRISEFYARSFKKLNILSVLCMIVGLLLLALEIVEVVVLDNKMNIGFVLIALFAIFFGIFYVFMSKSKQKKLVKLYEDMGNFNYNYEFTDEEINVYVEHASSSFKYEMIYKAYEEKELWVILFGSRGAAQMLMVRKDGFENPEDLDKFVALLGTKLGAKKVKSK